MWLISLRGCLRGRTVGLQSAGSVWTKRMITIGGCLRPYWSHYPQHHSRRFSAQAPFPLWGFISGPDESYTCGHYLPECSWGGGVRGLGRVVSERVYYSCHKFVFMFLTTQACVQHPRVCFCHPSETVFRTLTSMEYNEFLYATSIRENTLLTATKLDCCFAFQTSTAQAVRGHCVHFVCSL